LTAGESGFGLPYAGIEDLSFGATARGVPAPPGHYTGTYVHHPARGGRQRRDQIAARISRPALTPPSAWPHYDWALPRSAIRQFPMEGRSSPAGAPSRIVVMAEKTLPYLQAYGNITKTLGKIQTASTPDRFTQDFLATKLSLSGGGAKPVIPFLKRCGFLGPDGAPTELYKRFRNGASRGAAAAEATRKGFAPLYEVNEYAHAISDDKELRGLVVQVTGAEQGSSVVRSIMGSFKALKDFADFDAKPDDDVEEVSGDGAGGAGDGVGGEGILPGINLGYTINLHLPATSDIAVFNAIFKSLREHLVK
jgi:uncharacterized protein DUF5343